MDITKTSQSIFGTSSATTFFTAKLSTTSAISPEQQAASQTVETAKREINRIRGYKLQLTPADNQQLLKIQEQIQEIESKAREGQIRADEIEDRSELYRRADEIIGKPSADVENDTLLNDINEQISELRAPKLNGAIAKRLESLEKLKNTLTETIESGKGNRTTQLSLQNVVRQINEIDIPRNIHELSISDQREYDDLVERTNEHAGAKLLLTARESKRVYDLQQSISNLSSLLPADTSGQPTTRDVARAYARL